MSNLFGLILQSHQKQSKLSNLNLLIVNDEGTKVEGIVKALDKANADFTYCIISVNDISLYLSDLTYDAILYNYSLLNSYQSSPLPLDKLRWWQKIKKTVPLILITDVLGDEIAIECIQAGITGYVLRHKLYKLPIIIEKSLASFAQKQKQESQLAIIQHQQEYIKQLEREKQEQEQANPATQEFISHLNHELRSPIAAILGFARMLKEEIYGSLNDKQMQYIQAMATTGEHALDLINDYLDLAKVNADKEELEPEKLAVEDICRASLAIVAEKARQKRLKLNLDIDREVDFCLADKLRLQQILVNLLSNAVKFTQEGSVTLRITPQGQNLQFSVIDTGIGISEANQKKLFQPFQQIKNSACREEKGTGLGLALSRKLAILHGGDIVLTSTEGKGSCFTLYIPCFPKN
ncbi:MAG: HAMP domain-containing sensor histidine kinase [Xenococcaceae cyanobacterium MO_188.B32]|nr:HAMP domain-containing sensor histidine kinase [Xenococcaceae cyanobacterium MO_188.B32]